MIDRIIKNFSPFWKNQAMKFRDLILSKFYRYLVNNKLLFILMYKGLLIDLELTNSCNASCIMCPRHVIKSEGFLKEEIFKKIIRKVKKDKIKELYFCGLGEPLLHPKIADFIGYCIKNKINTSLNTNGYLFNPEMQDKLIKKGLKKVIFSIPSINKEIFERIHKGLSYDIVMNHLKEAIKRKEIDVSLNIVISQLNRNNIKELIEFCNDYHLSYTWFRINNRGIQDFNYDLILKKKYRSKDFTLKFGEICSISSLITFIGYNGGVYLCSNDVKRKNKLCNYTDYPINKIIYLKKMYFERQAKLCNSCTVSTYMQN